MITITLSADARREGQTTLAALLAIFLEEAGWKVGYTGHNYGTVVSWQEKKEDLENGALIPQPREVMIVDNYENPSVLSGARKKIIAEINLLLDKLSAVSK
jgi:hypothetical protein